MCLKGKVGRLFKDEETHWFLGSVGILTLLITLALVFQNNYGWELAFRKSLFQVATCIHPAALRRMTIICGLLSHGCCCL